MASEKKTKQSASSTVSGPSIPPPTGSHLQDVETKSKVSEPAITEFPEIDYIESIISPTVTRSKYPMLQDRNQFLATLKPDLVQRVIRYLEHTNGWTMSDLGNLILRIHFEISGNGLLALLARIQNEKLLDNPSEETKEYIINELKRISPRTIKIVSETISEFSTKRKH
ncbi:MAG: hypothetical protein ACYDG3_11160 [Bacillati bacterium]